MGVLQHNWQMGPSFIHEGDSFIEGHCSCGAAAIFKAYGSGEKYVYLYKGPGWEYYHRYSFTPTPLCDETYPLEPYVGEVTKKHFWLDSNWEKSGQQTKKRNGFCAICGVIRETSRTNFRETNIVTKYIVAGETINLVERSYKERAALEPKCTGFVNRRPAVS